MGWPQGRNPRPQRRRPHAAPSREALTHQAPLPSTADLDALEDRLATATDEWTRPSIVRVFSSGEDGREDFEDEVLLFEMHGYACDEPHRPRSEVTFYRTVEGAEGEPGETGLGPQTGFDPVAALETLATMRDRSLITTAEYDTRRQAILERVGERQADAPDGSAGADPGTGNGARPRAPYEILAGGILYAVGSALPWISITAPLVGTVTRSGLEGGDGLFTLPLGLAIAFVGFMRVRGNVAEAGRAGALVSCVVAVVLAFSEMNGVNQRIAGLDPSVSGLASVGIGIWAMVAGALIAGFGAVSLYRDEFYDWLDRRSKDV